MHFLDQYLPILTYNRVHFMDQYLHILTCNRRRGSHNYATAIRLHEKGEEQARKKAMDDFCKREAKSLAGGAGAIPINQVISMKFANASHSCKGTKKDVR